MKTISCSAPLVVQQYGGGTRYHCPKCDVRLFGSMLTAYWTNGPIPSNRKCDNKKPVPKTSSIFKNMEEIHGSLRRV
jgi:hypothetical protein